MTTTRWRQEMSADEYRATMTEVEFQATVMDAARIRGWLAVHFRQMVGNPSGWPDLILIRGRTTIYAELKREGGRVSRRQAEWIDRLRRVGADVRVWYPGDMDAIIALLSGEEGGAA